MEKESAKPTLKDRFNAFTNHKVGRWVWKWVWPFSNKVGFSGLIAIMAGNLAAHVMLGHMLPDIEDVAEEYNISEEAIASVEPYGTVKVQTDNPIHALHEMTRAPGVLGLAAYGVKKLRLSFANAYAYASHTMTPLNLVFSDSSLAPFGDVCVINIENAAPILRDNSDTEFSTDELMSSETGFAYFAIFHELRHCARDQMHGTHVEMDANYYADKAMNIQFGRDFNHRWEMQVGGEYDFTLYKEALDNGRPIPSLDELLAANQQVRDYYDRKWEERQERIAEERLQADPSRTERDIQAELEREEEEWQEEAKTRIDNTIDLSALIGSVYSLSDNIGSDFSELARRRFAHTQYAQIVWLDPNIDYIISDDDQQGIIIAREDVKRLQQASRSRATRQPRVGS